MNKNILTTVSILAAILLLAVNCSKSAEVTLHKNCDPSLKIPHIVLLVPIYSKPSARSKIVESISKGTIVKVYEYRNHSLDQREFVRVKTEKNEGWMSPRCLVIGQDPENSVFSWGYNKEYKPFYDPTDKSHYKSGYEFKQLASLPKEKIPLSELTKGVKFEE